MDRLKTKTITYQQLINFVDQQKPDRKIDSNCCNGKGIGCLLTQYCRKTFKNKVTHVGYSSCWMHKGDTVYNFICDKNCAILLTKALEKRFENYSQLQKFIKEQKESKKYYKLLSQNLTSYNNTEWHIGVPVTVSKEGNKMCTNQVLHCYNHPLLAVILNPVHANIANPRLFEISVDEIVANDGLKYASKSQTLIKELELPKISVEQKIEFGIRVVKLFCTNEKWNLWADKWLDGSDRSMISVNASRINNIHCANIINNAAAYYINSGDITSYTFLSAGCVAHAVNGCISINNNNFDKNEFNRKMIDIIENIVKVK